MARGFEPRPPNSRARVGSRAILPACGFQGRREAQVSDRRPDGCFRKYVRQIGEGERHPEGD